MIKTFRFENINGNVKFILSGNLTQAINKYVAIHKENLDLVIKIEEMDS
jgi:hypothetical protein